MGSKAIKPQVGALEVNMRTSYIHNFARTLAGQMHLESWRFCHCDNAQAIAHALTADYFTSISLKMANAGAETRAKLATCGAGDDATPSLNSNRVKMLEVHNGEKDWIKPHWSGNDIIWRMATTAVVAAMADNFWDECERQREVPRSFLAQREVRT